MDRQTVLKIIFIGFILLLIALIIEKQYPVTTLPMDYIVNTDPEESATDLIHESKEVTVYVSDFNNLVFPLTIDVSGTKSVYKDDVELTFSMLTEFSNYLPMGVKTIVPPSTRLIDYEIKNEELTLTVSKEFLNYNEEEIDYMKDILAYSFTEISGVKTVTIKCVEDVDFKSIASFKQLNRRNQMLNTVFKADELSTSKTMTVFYYTASHDDYFLVPVNIIVDEVKKSTQALIDEILLSYYINIPVTSYINEENIITVREELSNMKSGYTNKETDYSLMQYYFTMIANTNDISDEVENYNNYRVELR